MASSADTSPLYPGVEMFQKQRSSSHSFLDPRAPAPRPLSTATEIFDLEHVGEFEDGETSPRLSIESKGQDSDDASTISSFEDVTTPRNDFSGFDFQLECRPVEGPVGPHLFRTSQESNQGYSFHLSMSPVTPKETPSLPTPGLTGLRNNGLGRRPLTSLHAEVARLDPAAVALWSPSQVAKFMRNSGFDEDVAEKFEAHDISGRILITLQFDDLKELEIQSFGKRRELWSKIGDLRSNSDVSVDDSSSSSDDDRIKKTKKGSKRPDPLEDDSIISPLESVSIVGIEQLVPRPHKCAKGENCPKFRRQMKQRQRLQNEFPISPMKGGFILMAGNPGNAGDAPAIRPISDAIPSVVASSDVLGPGLTPNMNYDESYMQAMQARDQQDNVKQYLDMQKVQGQAYEDIERESPPLEIFPQSAPAKEPQMSHKLLPQLVIPPPPPPVPRSRSAQSSTAASQERMYGQIDAVANAQPDIYRVGSPASEMDVPVTAIPLGPVARDTSQSVPPDMKYRRGSVSKRASSRLERPTFAVQNKVDENSVWEPSPGSASAASSTSIKSGSITTGAPPQGVREEINSQNAHQGWMKKRKTKMLRHEWQEHHFRLHGTDLTMHRDAVTSSQLEHIDVDDYAVACSSIASNKLSAAFKQMKLATSSKKEAEGAFSFQLVPAADRKGNAVPVRGLPPPAPGKTHHFAVKSRDERIDWMRELMLAKALKQKGEAGEMGVNGNMI